MYVPFPTKKYKKSYVKLLHSGKFDEQELDLVIDTLAMGKKLESIFKDHALHGIFDGYRECHIRGNILLVYKIENKKLILVLFDIGTHSQLFG